MALTVRDVLIIGGSQFIGKGLEKLADWVDTQYAPGKTVWERPGTYITDVGGLAVAIGSYWLLKRYPTAQLVGVVAGTKAFTRIVDHLEETMTPTAVFVPAGAGVTFTPSETPAVKPTPTVTVGKYT